MSGSRSRNRRRRTGSTARRYKPSELIPIDGRKRSSIGMTEVLAALGVAGASIALIVLIWILATRTIADQRSEAREGAIRTLSSHAQTLAREIELELTMIDQSLSILQTAWKYSSDTFQLQDWKARVPALTAVADDIFIADDRRIVQQDIIPAAVGQGVGAAYVNFPHGSLETLDFDANRAESRLLVGQNSEATDARRYLTYIVRPLDHPKNWLIGASYRSSELVRLFNRAELGINGVAMVLDTRRGVIEAISGPPARRVKPDISKTAMFDVFQKNEGGIWTGVSAMDGTERVHAYQRVRGRDMAVVVGMTTSQVLLPVQTLTATANTLASLASILVIVIGLALLWGIFTIRSNRREARLYARGKTELLTAQTDLANARLGLQVTTLQLQRLMDTASDGVAVFDAAMNLTRWNERFAAACGIPAELVRDRLPMDELFRQQAQAGVLGPVEDTEVEVAQRIAQVRTETGGTSLPQTGPDGTPILLHIRPIQDGSFVAVLNGVSAVQIQFAGMAAADATTEIIAPTSAVEW